MNKWTIKPNLFIYTFTLFICLIFIFLGCSEKGSLQLDPGVPIDPIAPPPGEEPMPPVNTNFCQVGAILVSGESCIVEGTDATFTVLENNNGSFTSVSGVLFEDTDEMYINGSTLNGNIYWFSAKRVHEKSWRIEKLDPDDFD